MFTTPVVTLTGETLGVFVRQYGTLSLHDGPGCKVLRSNELEVRLLALKLLLNEPRDGWIRLG